MKKRVLELAAVTLLAILATSCALAKGTQDGNSTKGYPARWEEVELTTDEFGVKLIVIRPNEQMWELKAKTDCFWSRQYVGRTVWLKWGPVESVLMNDQGDTCVFWTMRRVDFK